MNFNVNLFFKINNLSGRNRWLDLFGKTGAEYVIVAMVGWYATAIYLANIDNKMILIELSTFVLCWISGWLISIFIGTIVREPRPHITYPQSRLLFQPMMSWKSFPSDHAMAAWLVVFLSVIFGLPGIEALVVLALWVSWGRVYSGLHYPFDIVGGLTVAAFVAMVAYNLLIILTP